MKSYLLTVIIIIAFCSIVHGQEEYAPSVEIFLGIVDNSDTLHTNNNNFYLFAVGTVWDGERISQDSVELSITTDYDEASYTPTDFNEEQGGWGGFDAGPTPHDNVGTYEGIAFGLYKLFTGESNTICYIDYRDTRYGRYDSTYGHPADIWVKYNAVYNNFYIKSGGTHSWGSPLDNFELKNIWGIK